MLKRAALLLAPQVSSGVARWIKAPEPRFKFGVGWILLIWQTHVY
jgi:hypothetical protein